MVLKKICPFSFFIWFSVALVFALPQNSNADIEAGLEATAVLQNQISNNPSYEFNSYPGTALMKSISAIPPSLIFDSPSPTQPYLGSDFEVFTGRGYYFEQELYTRAEVLKFIKEEKDVIQTFGKLYDTPAPGEPIKLLKTFPMNLYDLGGVQFTGPTNGSMKEAIERAKAYAYFKFGSQNMWVNTSYLHYNLSAVGNSGGNLGAGTVQGEVTSNVGLAPSTGVTASTVYRRPVVIIQCFSNHPSKSFPEVGINLLDNSRQLLIDDYAAIFDEEQQAVIAHNAKLLVSKLASGAKIEILVFAPGKSAEKFTPLVQKIMNILGARLYRAGNEDDFLNKVIKAKIVTSRNDAVSKALMANNALAVVVLNVN